MATDSASVERILVLLDDDRGDGPLEAGAELAAGRGAQLVALFVEDSDLLSSSGLPFAREIGLASGVARPLTAGAVEHSLAERARRLRARLERLARERGCEAVFEIGRGRRAHAVLRHIRPEDLLVVRRSDWPRRPAGVVDGVLGAASCAVLLIGRATAVTAVGPPMVYVDRCDGAGRALARALAFARSDRGVVSLLLAPGAAGPQLRREATRMLADHGIEPRFVELGRADVLELLRALRRERPRLLFVGRDSPLLAGPAGRELAELDEVPLVVVP